MFCYGQMLRLIEPKAIICYCEPFEEMEGNIIKVDYAETNRLSQKKSFYGYAYNDWCESGLVQLNEMLPKTSSSYVTKTSGYIVTTGMGSGGTRSGRSSIHLHPGKQGKHMPGHNNYIEGRSIMYGNMESIQKLLNEYAGRGQKIGVNRERVDFEQIIGRYINPQTRESQETTIGTIHYANDNAHIVPGRPRKGE